MRRSIMLVPVLAVSLAGAGCRNEPDITMTRDYDGPTCGRDEFTRDYRGETCADRIFEDITAGGIGE